MNSLELINDIPRDLAQAAYSGISFTPEKRAEQTREGYAALLAGDYADLQAVIANKPEMQSTLNAEFARFREGYRQRYLRKLASDSRCMSSMITGPSNFPTARNQKRNNIAYKRLTELLEFRERALAAIRKTLCPELRPIMSGDSDAVARLREKIEAAEKVQVAMKASNAAIRKHAKAGPEAQIAALVALGRTEATARALLQPDFCGRIGFADYEMTNNNANIRRMKERLAGLERTKAEPAKEQEGEFARLEDCPAENRIRLFFPGKPSAEVRDRLKGAGFRWSPTIGCWQAYRNWRSQEAAQREIGRLAVAEIAEA